MDEHRLGALFRDAVGEPPPATFGPADVVAASRRATARRRNTLAAGSLLGVAVLAVGVTISGHMLPGQGLSGHGLPGQGLPGQGLPGHSSTAGWHPEAAAAEAGPRTLAAPQGAVGAADREQTRCGPLDGELAAQLSAVLADRGATIAGPPGEVPGPCSEGSRAAAVPVTGGTFYLVVAPPGRPPDVQRPDGARGHALTSGERRELVVISVPVGHGQQAPLADQLPDLARELANRL